MSWSFDVEVEVARDALCSIDFPFPGTRLYGDRLEVLGWATGRGSPAVAVEVAAAGQEPCKAAPTLARPDVAAAFPDVPHAGRSGFSLVARVPEAARTELLLSIIFANGDRVEGGLIRLTGQRSEGSAGPDAPVVSVVIPCYNQGRFLREAIESARGQTYPHVEVIVVDDGSTDRSAAVAAQLGARCIRQANRGPSSARNRGVTSSTGEYLIFLDADDRLLPHGVEANLAAFEAHPEAAFVSGWSRHIGPRGEPVPWSILPPPPPEGHHYAAALDTSYWTSVTSILFRREPLIAKGGFDERLPACEDWDLYVRLARDNEVYTHQAGPIFEYRQHPDSLSRDSRLMLNASLAALRAQRRYGLRDASARAAYRRGVSRVRRFYGDELARDLVTAARRRDHLGVLRAAWTLLRRYPRGLWSAFSQLLHVPQRSPSRSNA